MVWGKELNTMDSIMPDMKQIKVGYDGSHPIFALVDDVYYDFLVNRSWNVTQINNQLQYATRKEEKTIYMHRAIYQIYLNRVLNKSEEIDHIDGNGLNNQISNLRLVTRSQNQSNQRHHRDSKSPYIGVHFNERYSQPWRVKLMVNGENFHSPKGFYHPEEAAEERDLLAVKHFGRYTKLNFESKRSEYEAKLKAGYDPDKKERTYSSKHPGVHLLNSKWIARITVDKKTIYLGSFQTEEEALNVRNEELTKRGLSLSTRLNKK